MIMPNGTLRDTYVYSITASEWPTVKAHLGCLRNKFFIEKAYEPAVATQS